MDNSQMREQIKELLYNGQLETLSKILLDNRETVMKNNDFVVISLLLSVYEQERCAGQKTVFEKERNMDALIERCIKLKFYLHRIEFDVMDENMNEFYEFVVKNAVSSYELLAAIDYYVINKNKVLQIIQDKN